MSRRFLPLIALAVCLLLLPLSLVAPPAQAAIPPGYSPHGPGDVYLALGDSLATGYEVKDDGQPGYPANLYDYLKTVNPALAYKNLAVDGTTSTKLLNEGQLASAEQFIAEQRAQGKRVGLITLSVGGNDIVTILPKPIGENAVPTDTLKTYQANLVTIITRLQAALTVSGTLQGDVVLMDYYNPYPGLKLPQFGLPDPLADIWVPQFNAATKAVAAAHGLAVAEVAQVVQGREAELLYVKRPNGGYADINPFDPNVEQQVRADYDFHPRPAGQRVIAEEFAKVLSYTPLQATHLAFVTRS